MSRLTKGTLIGVIGVAIWSSTAVFIRALVSTYQMPALQLALWRDTFVCVGLLPVLFIFRRSLLRISRAQVGYFMVYGLLLAGFNSIWTLSVKYNGAAVSTVMAYGSTGFTALLAYWLFRERLGLPKIAAVIFSLGGCVLVAGAYDLSVWQTNPIGLTMGLLSGFLFAVYTLVGKETIRRGINSWSALLFSFAFAAFFLLVANLIPAMPETAGSLARLLPALPAWGWLLLVTLAFGPTLLGYGLYNLSMRYLPASIANLIATLEPVFTAIQSYIFLGERLAFWQWMGGLLVLSAVVIVRLGEERGEQPARVAETNPG